MCITETYLECQVKVGVRWGRGELGNFLLGGGGADYGKPLPRVDKEQH